MTSHGFPESDWKTFRELQQLALERFCKRVLEEVESILKDGSRTHHERYLDVFRLLRKRDDQTGARLQRSAPLDRALEDSDSSRGMDAWDYLERRRRVAWPLS